MNLVTSHDLHVIRAIADAGSFSGAASRIGITPSGVSKAVIRLEHRLGRILVIRSTRSLSLTPEGEYLAERAVGLLSELESLGNEMLGERSSVEGRLTVSVGTAFAHHVVTPILPRFHEAYPRILLELVVTDDRVDPDEDRIDIAVRTGKLEDSPLIARRIGTTRRRICASPDYLETHGHPLMPSQLSDHRCLALLGFPGLSRWPFSTGDSRMEHVVQPVLSSSSAEQIRDLAIQGFGIARLSDFIVGEALAKGKLVELFQGIHLPEDTPVTALVRPGSVRLRRVQEFLAALRRAYRETVKAG